MAFQSGGFIGNRNYFIGTTSENIATCTKYVGAILHLTDNDTWFEYDPNYVSNSGWRIYKGDPVNLLTSATAPAYANLVLGGTSVSESNPLPIKTSLLSGAPAIVYNAISATPVTPYTLVLEGTGIKEIKLITSGTSTSRTMTFKAKLNATDTFTPFLGVNLSNATDTLAVSTTGQGEIWTFSGFDGVHSIEFNVTAVAGGNFTVWSETLI